MENTKKSMDIDNYELFLETDSHSMLLSGLWNKDSKHDEVICTEDGYKFKATFGHYIKIMDENGNFLWKAIENLNSKDWFLIPTKNWSFGNDEISKFNYNYHTRTAEACKKKYKFPTKLTKDYATLLGLLIGDGLCTNRNDIRLCICEDEMGEFIQSLFERLFNNSGRIYGHWIYMGGVELRAYLQHLGLTYTKSFEKIVPKAIFNASKENCAAFIRALMDTDGCVRIDGRNKNTKRIHLATTSKRLAEQVQLLFLNFGIVSKIYTVSVDKKKNGFIKGRKINSVHTRYDLTIKGSKSISSFVKNIGFNLKRKQMILNTSIPSKRDVRKIPNQRRRIIRLFKQLSLEDQRKDICKVGRFTRSSRGKATKELTYEKAKEFIEVYGQSLKNNQEFIKLQEFFLMDYYYSKLKVES